MELLMTLIPVVLTLTIFVIGILGVKFALDIYKYNRSSKGWLSMLITLFIVPIWALFRIYIISSSFVSYSNSLAEILDIALFPLLALIPLVVGLWFMKKNFETFEITKNMTANKISSMKKGRR
jgi:hypothetical protein